VKAELGKGFSFGATAPMQPVEGMIGEEPLERTEEAQAPGRRILVAEDNRVNQIVMAKLLGRLGCEVAVAENGLEALAILRRGGWTCSCR